MKRLLLTLILVLNSAISMATVSIQDRSLLKPGLWWSGFSGSGLDISTVENQIFVVWYTYRQNGSPIWYSAQGTFDANQVLQADLLLHRWANGSYAGNQVAGQIKLTRANFESAKFEWSFNSSNLLEQPVHSGSLNLKPFEIAAWPVEVDHSGIWFDPAKPGFGLSFAERQGVIVAAFYYYDANGAPTWLLAQPQNPPGEGLVANQFNGSCSGCLNGSNRIVGSGRVDFQLGGETELSFRVTTPIQTMSPEWQLNNRPLTMLSKSVSARSAERQLAQFGSDLLFEQTIRAAVVKPPIIVRDKCLPIRSCLPVVQSITSTNLQVSGGDEGDLVKNDANVAYTFAVDSRGVRNGKVRVASIGPSFGAVNEFQLAAPRDEANLKNAQLYLDSTKLTAITGGGDFILPSIGLLPYRGSPISGKTYVEIFTRQPASQMQSVWRASFDGHLVDSRKIGDQLFLVKRFAPTLQNYQYFNTSAAAIAQNQTILNNTSLAQLMPQKSINGGVVSTMMNARDVWLPPLADRVITAQYLILTRINLANPVDHESMAVLGDVDAAHLSQNHLYVATSRAKVVNDGFAVYLVGNANTEIHQIPLSSGPLEASASGLVEGYIDRGYGERDNDDVAASRFSEYKGVLRVLTVKDVPGAVFVNRLHVLSRSAIAPGLLQNLAVLPNSNRPESIGAPNGPLAKSRYRGDLIYAETTGENDPLYVIDVSNLRDPKIIGRMDIPGSSDYLYPLENNLLLAFGKEAIQVTDCCFPRGTWYQGLQIGLFDVSNPAQPRRIQNLVFGLRGSESSVLENQHGLSILQTPFGYQFAVPMRIHSGETLGNPNNPSSAYAYTQSVLQPIEIRSGVAGWSMIPKAPLVTASAPTSNGEDDDAGLNARSILFNDRLIYIERGRFWTAPWQTPNLGAGPF